MATVTSVTSGPPRGAEAAYGLCYGTKTSQTPNPVDQLEIYKKHNISKMWLSPAPFSTTDKAVTKILDLIINDSNHISKIKVVLWIDYKDLGSLAADENYAGKWVNTYVKPYNTVIGHVCVGDVIGPQADLSFSTFKGAVSNLKKYLSEVSGAIKLSTIVNEGYLFRDIHTAGTHPSTCVLSAKASELLHFLSSDIVSPIPLFVAIMPYFMIERDGVSVDNCILGPEASTYMHDNNIDYNQAFDAMVDSICCALSREEKLGQVDIIAVSGWPTMEGSQWASKAYANTYITNLVQKYIGKPTPRKNKPVDFFIYSIVNEDELETSVKEFKYLGAEAYLPSP